MKNAFDGRQIFCAAAGGVLACIDLTETDHAIIGCTIFILGSLIEPIYDDYGPNVAGSILGLAI